MTHIKLTTGIAKGSYFGIYSPGLIPFGSAATILNQVSFLQDGSVHL
jgi:hypothetical protein